MPLPSLCIVTPTISRPTLVRALRSAVLAPGDEWLVIGDGSQPEAEALVAALNVPGMHYIEGPETHTFGNAQRDSGMSLAAADYFLFLDDDDVFTPGALEAVRRQMAGVPAMFRMHHNGGVIWREQVIAPGNTGGSMFCVPNVPGKFGRWGDSQAYTSDQQFMLATMKHWPTLVWSGEIIVECNPQ
jgi:glycosyltransferase involved in cell wall biosynthesis